MTPVDKFIHISELLVQNRILSNSNKIDVKCYGKATVVMVGIRNLRMLLLILYSYYCR